jgi:hypothetical protein
MREAPRGRLRSDCYTSKQLTPADACCSSASRNVRGVHVFHGSRAAGAPGARRLFWHGCGTDARYDATPRRGTGCPLPQPPRMRASIRDHC